MTPKWLEIAFQELRRGVVEVAGSGNSPQIVAYLKGVHQAADDEIPWCAAFVGWCLTEAGELGSGRANARSYLSWGSPSAPTFGAVAVLWRGTPDSAQGHVAFFLDASDSVVYLLGGNQGDRVSVTSYPKSRVLGYRWPDLTTGTTKT